MSTPFNLLDPLPAGRTVLEASAGTGKTYSLTALITRYIAEMNVPVDQFLVVTFTRAAANELRERVREMLRTTAEALRTGIVPDAQPWMAVLVTAQQPAVAEQRRQRLLDALGRFDDLTITTIHGFCQQALAQSGFRSGSDPDAVLVENTREIVAEVCRDIVVSTLADDATLLNSPRGAYPTIVHAGQAEKELIENVQALMSNPAAVIVPVIGTRPSPDAAWDAAARWSNVTSRALAEVVNRQRARGEVGYDELITALHRAITDPRHGQVVVRLLAQRFTVVLVDEFQDTDRTQWDIFRRAFSSRTLITVGDPKQSIYRFRGADVHAYLEAVSSTVPRELLTNFRSDRQLLLGLATLFHGATLGDPRISFTPIGPRPDAPVNSLGDGPAVRLRAVPLRDHLRTPKGIDQSMPLVRSLVLADLVERIIDLLDHGTLPPTDGGAPVPVLPGDIAVLVPSHADANNVAEALRRARIPAVRTRTGSVLQTPALLQWRLVLSAMAQPHRAAVVRAAALGWFMATDVALLAANDDTVAALQERAARMADLMRKSGVGAFYDEQKRQTALLLDVLGHDGGERNLTDLDHIAEMLADAAHGGRSEPANVLRVLDEMVSTADERSEAAMRRIDTDAKAVQITTIHAAKGLEYGIVLVPFSFKGRGFARTPTTFTDSAGRRVIDIASRIGWDDGPAVAGDETTRQNQEWRRLRGGVEVEGDELRLLYVALTRARHRLEIWWAQTQRAETSALARVLLDRAGAGPIANSVAVPTAKKKGFTAGKLPQQTMSQPERMQQLHDLAAASDGHVGLTVIADHIEPAVWTRGKTAGVEPLRSADRRGRHAVADPSWQRWSFSRMGSVVESLATALPHDAALPADTGAPTGAGYDEPADDAETDVAIDVAIDASRPVPIPITTVATVAPIAPGASVQQQFSFDEPAPTPPPSLAVIAHLAAIPGGTRFGTFVHSVLEELDCTSPALETEIDSLVRHHAALAGLDLDHAAVVAGLVAAVRTPLGPLFAGRSLAEIPPSDRLAELTFDLAITPGRTTGAPAVSAGAIGEVLLHTLPDDDPLRGFATQLMIDYADLRIAGWMHGSIDAVLRVPDGSGDHRYLVVDYKTNRLHAIADAGDVAVHAYRPNLLIPAMEHSRYPLQALLYTVAVHRYLRSRLGARYDPEQHLGGVGYLFVRGMVGTETPSVDGVAHGVFSWRPPTRTVLALDQLFATGVVA